MNGQYVQTNLSYGGLSSYQLPEPEYASKVSRGGGLRFSQCPKFITFFEGFPLTSN